VSPGIIHADLTATPFAPYLRYQAANERAYSRCLKDLLTIRAEKRKEKSEKKKFLRKGFPQTYAFVSLKAES
jgi:nucleoside phosphorylase